MSRYYFDLHNGDGPTRDEQGQDISSRAGVTKEVTRILLDVAGEEIPTVDRIIVSVTVRDHTGKSIAVASLAFNNEWLE